MYKLIFFLLMLLSGMLVYYLFLDRIVSDLYCRKQISYKVYKFLEAVKRDGASERIEYNQEVKQFVNQLRQKCLK